MQANTTLLFDFSNMLFRAIFMCANSPEYEVSTFDTQSEINLLVRKLATDMSYIVRLVNPDRVIVACDSNNAWRKRIYDEIPGESYKGTRDRDDNKNWSNIFDNVGKFKEVLASKNWVVADIPHAEADDVAAMYKEKVMGEGDNLILVSSDKDWLQLVEFNSHFNNFCIVFNPIAHPKTRQKRFIGTEDFVEWMNADEKGDIFFTNYSPIKQKLADIFKKDTKLSLEIVDPLSVVLGKIMCGDDGDNVPAIYQFYKNAKKVRVTPLRSKKIMEDAGASDIPSLCESAENGKLLSAMEKVFKMTIDDVDMKERLLRQRKLVELHSELFPDDVTTPFKKFVKKTSDMGSIDTVNCNVETMLDGTEFLSNYSKLPKAKTSSVFDDLSDMERFIKKDTKKRDVMPDLKISTNVCDELF